LALFDAQFVYSDLKNEDYQDFGKTKTVGRLINAVTEDFQKSDVFTNLKKAHKKAFGDEGLTATLKGTQNKLKEIIAEQYGKTEVKFNFGLPELDNFFKTGQILLSDNGVETEVSEKGTGMQRALALALIQLYADVQKNKNTEKLSSNNLNTEKPLLFLIDEPETFLHPIAQDRLIDSLSKISEKSQVFITTHSPYLLKKFDKNSNQINVFSRDKDRISANKELDLFPFSPTWGEINYVAFQVYSSEFHNELYGYLESYFKQHKGDEDFIEWKSRFEEAPKTTFALWLNFQDSSINSDIDYFNDKIQKMQKSALPQFVRDIIHHPENEQNKYCEKQLSDSIDLMERICHI